MNIVLHEPPIESFKIFVSFDCLYGIWSLYLSERATTTCSKNVKDLFIYEASINCCPSDPKKIQYIIFFQYLVIEIKN